MSSKRFSNGLESSSGDEDYASEIEDLNHNAGSSSTGKKRPAARKLSVKRGRSGTSVAQAKRQKISENKSRSVSSSIRSRKHTNNNDEDSDAELNDRMGFDSLSKKVTSQKNTTGKKRGRTEKSKISNRSRSPLPSTSGINNVTSSQNCRRNDSDSDDDKSSSDYTSVGGNRKRKTKNDNSLRKSPRKKNSVNYSVNKSSKLSQASIDSTCDPSLVESLAQKCVYFLLVENQTKHAIKRKAIVQHVFKDENYSSKLYFAVICEASRILMKTFGMELLVLENQKDSYMIINNLKRELGIEEYVDLPQLKHQQNGLILYLLTVIFMNGNSITEDELGKAMKPLGIDFSSRKVHPIFGDVKKYITIELVKQMYLTHECINKDPPQYEIKWGLRAKQELDKKDLLNFASEILDTTPENWILQFRDAEESANL